MTSTDVAPLGSKHGQIPCLTMAGKKWSTIPRSYLGEYIGRIYIEVKNRPRYVIRKDKKS